MEPEQNYTKFIETKLERTIIRQTTTINQDNPSPATSNQQPGLDDLHTDIDHHRGQTVVETMMCIQNNGKKWQRQRQNKLLILKLGT